MQKTNRPRHTEKNVHIILKCIKFVSNPLFYSVTVIVHGCPIKPWIGCCGQLWSPHSKKSMEQQQAVERKARRMTKGSKKHDLKGKTE